MCTVTLVPSGENDFILTSNRDESVDRNTIAPAFYTYDSHRILFPKDEVAGGTWIGINDSQRVICLLNGGSMPHERKLPYKKSRGTVVVDLLTSQLDFRKSIELYNFEGIEPFTLIAADWQKKPEFFEVIWDGRQIAFRTLERKIHIWSSSTLYTIKMKQKRVDWLNSFIKTNSLNASSMLNFHKYAGVGNPEIDLQIDRELVKTRSITQILKEGDEYTMRYEDLLHDKITSISSESLTVSTQ